MSEICTPARQSAKQAIFTRYGNNAPLNAITSNVRESALFGYFLTSTISTSNSVSSLLSIISLSYIVAIGMLKMIKEISNLFNLLDLLVLNFGGS